MITCLTIFVFYVVCFFQPEYKMADPICTFLFSVFVLFTTFTIIRDILVVLMEGESPAPSPEPNECVVVRTVTVFKNFLSTSFFSHPSLRYSSRAKVRWGTGQPACSERSDSGPQPSHLGPYYEPGCTDCTCCYKWEETSKYYEHTSHSAVLTHWAVHLKTSTYFRTIMWTLCFQTAFTFVYIFICIHTSFTELMNSLDVLNYSSYVI